MIQSFNSAIRRFHVIRYLLIIVFAFVILLVGSMLVGRLA